MQVGEVPGSRIPRVWLSAPSISTQWTVPAGSMLVGGCSRIGDMHWVCSCQDGREQECCRDGTRKTIILGAPLFRAIQAGPQPQLEGHQKHGL